MKRVMEWTLGIAGYMFIKAALPEETLFFSRETLLIVIGGVCIAISSKIDFAAKNFNKWPWNESFK